MRGTLPWRPVRDRQRRFIPAYAGNALYLFVLSLFPAVHPRVCGERLCQGAMAVWYLGSSPRMRGTLRSLRVASLFKRFIPAYAGNAWEYRRLRRAWPVHPRVCGERLGPTQRRRAELRFIPAYAGNAPRRRGARARSPVHPRVCGERVRAGIDGYAGAPVHPRVCGERGGGRAGGRRSRRFIPAYAGNAATLSSRCPASNGSSPRMRGTLRRVRGLRQDQRFIPAYAGNARRTARGCWRTPVHPRVCGERLLIAPFASVGVGSSPRMRGTQKNEFLLQQFVRFIPAYAGNAARYPLAGGNGLVHPRVCGERATPGARTAAHYRFIPAYAGNAPLQARLRRLRSVHPRVCGERPSAFPTSERSGGSSPRMRGTHRVKWQDRQLRRFIPAYAGNAPPPPRRAASTPVHPRVCGERPGTAHSVSRCSS